jgi:hypothetical protein
MAQIELLLPIRIERRRDPNRQQHRRPSSIDFIHLQPAYAKSDRQFNAEELLTSTTINSDRSSNEQAVNAAKKVGVCEPMASRKCCEDRNHCGCLACLELSGEFHV